MDLIKDGWFEERNHLLWPGECFKLQIKNILHSEKSKYQDILIIDTVAHGRCLVLDGIIQCTERDEFSYQEMISMLPLQAHGQPKSVLIVGGGDGGVAREVVKHPLVSEVAQIEIDERVVELSKKFLPKMSCGFDHPKVTLRIGDGFEYLRQHNSEFDVIITDSSDPIGPNESLFRDDYFLLLKKALKPDGIICCQGGAPWLELEQIRKHMDACRKYFPVVGFALTSVPTYPTGQIGFVIGSLSKDCKLDEPKGPNVENLQYYDRAVHKSAFTLPAFVRKHLFDQ